MSRSALPVDRYLLKIRRDARTGCDLYPTRSNRYPQMWVNGRSIGIHRIALQLHLARRIGLPKGLPLPPRAMVLHRPGCVSKACVRGDHLYVGDGSLNLKDALLAGHRPVKLTRKTARKVQLAPRTRRARRRLAEQLGVTTGHVRAVQSGRCWAWLDAESVAT